jgi:hypothetical protein
MRGVPRELSQLLKFESARLFHLFARDVADGLREGPVVAFAIGGDIGALAVELVFGLFHDARAFLPRAGAVRVDAALDADVNTLRVLAAERGGAARPIELFGADHHDAVAMGHFGMDDGAVRIGHDFARHEAEGALEEVDRGAIVFIDERRDERRAAGRSVGHDASSRVPRFYRGFPPPRRLAMRFRHRFFVSGAQPGEDRRLGRLRAEMKMPQLVHELGPELGAAFLEELCAHRQFVRSGRVAPSPGAHLCQERHELDGFLGQADDLLLLMRRIWAGGEEAGLGQLLQPVGQDVGRDAFDRVVEQVAVMPPVAEHDVADDDEAPAIAQHLERQVDRASGAGRLVHGEGPSAKLVAI